MDTILCDISAWQYWQTPPELRDASAPARAKGTGSPDDMDPWARRLDDMSHRRASVHERRILREIDGVLKGVTLPVHIATKGFRGETELIQRHVLPEWIQENDCVPIADGIRVLTPAQCLTSGFSETKVLPRTVSMMEAMGIYTVEPRTSRMATARKSHDAKLVRGKTQGQQPRIHPVSAYYEAAGDGRLPIQAGISTTGWTPALDRLGNPTGMWKRPPLVSWQDLERALILAGHTRRTNTIRRALELSAPGSGSPLETAAYLVLCGGAYGGFEKWPRPLLNARLTLSGEAAAVAGYSSCIPDMLWEEKRIAVELNGEAYHADKNGFRLASNKRAALESMGYRILELTYQQIFDIKRYDAIIQQFSSEVGLPIARRTDAYLEKRRRARIELQRALNNPRMF